MIPKGPDDPPVGTELSDNNEELKTKQYYCTGKILRL
jgi:hypothetical protein